MIWLDSASIQYAIDLCKKQERCRVGIAFFNQQRMNSAKALISVLTPQPDNRFLFIQNRHNFEVRFYNGSILRAIRASESSRGHKVNLLIVDKDIPEHIVRYVLQPLETLGTNTAPLNNQIIYATSRGR